MNQSDSQEIKQLQEELHEVKKRLSKIESVIKSYRPDKQKFAETKLAESSETIELPKEKATLESRAGEYGMAWIGNIVLLFCFVFLINHLQDSGRPLISFLAGAASVIGLYLTSFFSRKTYAYLSKLFSYGGHLLLFYVAIRLHFVQGTPLLASKTIALFFILLVLAGLFYVAYRKESGILSGIVLLMMLTSGIISNSVPFLASMGTLVSILSIGLYYKYGWIKLVFGFILLVYLAHLCWLLNNPIANMKIELPQSHGLNYIHLFASGFIFSLVALLPVKENISKEILIAATIWNGLGFTLNLVIATIFFYQNNFIPLYSSIAVFCIAYSFLLQIKSSIKITPSMYALYGFLALSVALYGIFLFPRTFLFLALESLLVVSMALWFRSRFIVVMNTLLFLILLGTYLGISENTNDTNFAFMLTAFLTARIINWKKERLNIRTELMRNTYLLVGFVMTLVAFYHAFPKAYISISWIGAALLFFAMSLLLRNFKYRWLAIATIVATTIKLIFIDMSDIEIIYRILIFLLLAIISITVSILYTKFFRKK